MGSAFLMLPTRSIILNTNVPVRLISFSVSSCKLWCPYLILETVKDQNSHDMWELVMPKVEIQCWATSWFYPSTLSYQSYITSYEFCITHCITCTFCADYFRIVHYQLSACTVSLFELSAYAFILLK